MPDGRVGPRPRGLLAPHYAGHPGRVGCTSMTPVTYPHLLA